MTHEFSSRASARCPIFRISDSRQIRALAPVSDSGLQQNKCLLLVTTANKIYYALPTAEQRRSALNKLRGSISSRAVNGNMHQRLIPSFGFFRSYPFLLHLGPPNNALSGYRRAFKIYTIRTSTAALPKADGRGPRDKEKKTATRQEVVASLSARVPRAHVGVVVLGGVLGHEPAPDRVQIIPLPDPRLPRLLLHLEVPELSVSTPAPVPRSACRATRQ